MKRLILGLLLLGCIALTSSAWAPTVTLSGTSSSADYSDIVFWLNFNNGPTGTSSTYTLDSTEHSAGDTTGTTDTGSSVDTAAKKAGSYGLDLPTAYDDLTFGAIANIKSEGRIGMWLKFSSWSDNNTITYLRYSTSSNQLTLKLAGVSSSDIEFSMVWNGQSSAVTLESDLFGGDITTGWVFVEWAWKQSTNHLAIYINGTQYGVSSASLTAMAGEFNTYVFGEEEGVALDFYIAQIIISNDSTRDLYALSSTLNYPG